MAGSKRDPRLIAETLVTQAAAEVEKTQARMERCATTAEQAQAALAASQEAYEVASAMLTHAQSHPLLAQATIAPGSITGGTFDGTIPATGSAADVVADEIERDAADAVSLGDPALPLGDDGTTAATRTAPSTRPAVR